MSHLPKLRPSVLLAAALSGALVSLPVQAESGASHSTHSAPAADHSAPTADAKTESKPPSKEASASPSAPKGKRLEDDAEALEKIRQILHQGIPERATVKLPVNSGSPETSHSASLHGTSTVKTAAAAKTSASGKVDAHAVAKGNSTAKDAHDPHHWTYEGPSGPAHWADLSPDNSLCAQGRFQSPIHITTQEAVALNLEPIEFNYESLSGTIVNNGHTIQVNVDSENSISVRGQQYKLLQFHFHHPSEERINGRTFPMVIHMVHKSEAGQLAVVGVMVEDGTENAVVNHLWSRLPFLEGQTNPLTANTFDLISLLPKERGYFTFTGSLTTPPCSENVLWMVMQKPISFSPSQIDTFGRLYPHNARPLQQVNRRLIQSSQ